MLVAATAIEPIELREKITNYRETVWPLNSEIKSRTMFWPNLVSDRLDALVDAVRTAEPSLAEFTGVIIIASHVQPSYLGQLVGAYRELKVGDFDPTATEAAISVPIPPAISTS
jgi:hypothetical protein